MPCLGCLKKYSVPPLLFCLCFPPGPTSRRRDSAAKSRLVGLCLQQCQGMQSMSCPVTRVCVPRSTSPELDRTRQAPWGAGGDKCQGIGNPGTILSADARAGGGRAGDGGEKGGWKVATLGWKNLEEYKGERDEKGWRRRGGRRL